MLPPMTKRAEALDDLAGVALAQDQAGHGDVDRQAEQRGDQQQGREGGEVERALGVDRDQHDRERGGDVQRDEHVQQHVRDRHDHHDDDRHEPEGDQQVALAQDAAEDAGPPGRAALAVAAPAAESPMYSPTTTAGGPEQIAVPWPA